MRVPNPRLLRNVRMVVESVEVSGKHYLVIYLLAYRYPVSYRRVEEMLHQYKSFLEGIYYELCVAQRFYDDVVIAYILFNKNVHTKKHPGTSFNHRLMCISFSTPMVISDVFDVRQSKWRKDTGGIPSFVYGKAMDFINFMYRVEDPEGVWEKVE